MKTVLLGQNFIIVERVNYRIYAGIFIIFQIDVCYIKHRNFEKRGKYDIFLTIVESVEFGKSVEYSDQNFFTVRGENFVRVLSDYCNVIGQE